MIGLAELGGPIACIGLAVLILARRRVNRIAGLCYAGVGSILLAASFAPANAAELGGAVAGVIVFGPLLAWLFRREPWLVAYATLALVPARVGFLGHQLLVPLYVVALGAAGLLLWELVDGDERTRELGIASWPLALYLVWIGLSVEWSVGLHAGAIDLLAFYVPFTIIAVSIARLPGAPRASASSTASSWGWHSSSPPSASTSTRRRPSSRTRAERHQHLSTPSSGSIRSSSTRRSTGVSSWWR